MMEEAKSGHVFGSGSAEGATVLKPDVRFAKQLCDEQNWRALAVYAYHWMKNSFVAGDSDGFHWLSVAFRNLGFEEAADACLEFGLRVPRALMSKREQR